ncbi:high frequency lysogenization protein HflD [Zymobacter palmae]|uniref:High frequency lysogenization protein HflD homolog n=1 Tax=Zymobacter palmae TaxID=33074 RepID=A0A348HCH2_9GAMM|nr:high frequency lysogenization protein HflD [Zymobacter palmae]BBG29324.1 uncharacterized protein ZBT109_0536 [Zymobacter palmae]
MSTTRRQAIALAGVFQAAATVDSLARTGQHDTTAWRTLIDATLDTEPADFESVYGGQLSHLQLGLDTLRRTLDDPSHNAVIARYAMAMLMLMHRLRRDKRMMTTLGERLARVRQQAGHFGPVHENVVASLGELYQDTLSTLPRRIVVQGDPGLLQMPMMPERIRAALLSGIRFAMLWYQMGGRRWHLIFRGGLKRQLDELTR